MVICVLAFHAYNKTDLLSKRWIPNTKTIIKAKKFWFFLHCVLKREGTYAVTNQFVFDAARSRCKPNATQADRFQPNNTSCQVVLMEEGRRKTPLKCCNLIAGENTVFFFFLNNYLFTFTKQSRSNNTNTKVLSCKFFKKTSKVSWNMSHFLTLVYFTEGICWIFGIFKVRRGG